MNHATDDFLPREYIEHRQDRRMHIAATALFIVVVGSLAIAFLLQRTSWTDIRAIREEVSQRYMHAAEQVQTLNELEAQMDVVQKRAMLAAGLVDRLPRSVVLAEFINRMPDGLGLMEFELTTTKIEPPAQDAAKPAHKPKRPPTTAESESAPIDPPRWNTAISLLGFAPTDVHVSAFLAALNDHALLDSVTLVFSEEVELNDVPVRQFSIRATIGPDADIGVTALSDATGQGGH